ncbi:MAG TPA: dihydroxyacetone kinase subunit DhaK [Bryobacteraceae bacterium]|nr:dihydroxyacetone kinase subunit DhaK [Bryobacteraceae bacterium]
MKKLINNPDAVASETLDGLALAYPLILRKVEGVQSVIRCDAPVAGKVAVLTGGGSGHEPLFAGYVGRGLADGSVAGNIFASPPPGPIVATAKAIHAGRGVLFLYGNYSGDILNFDTAAEELADEGLEVVTVRISDDVASAPPDSRDKRRGIAGDIFLVKVASAAAEEFLDLAAVAAAAEKANENTRSMAVALSSCIIPASGKPIFEISESEMELGMGVHGEPGVQRRSLISANEVADFLLRHILDDLPVPRGEEVAVLVNGAGATPLGELFIIFRRVSHFLEREGIRIFRSYVGNYATSLDMAGCSVTLMRLDADLKRWLSAPCEGPGLVQV